MPKTYEYTCECGHNHTVSEVEAYRTGSHSQCKVCGKPVIIYITFKRS